MLKPLCFKFGISNCWNYNLFYISGMDLLIKKPFCLTNRGILACQGGLHGAICLSGRNNDSIQRSRGQSLGSRCLPENKRKMNLSETNRGSHLFSSRTPFWEEEFRKQPWVICSICWLHPRDPASSKERSCLYGWIYTHILFLLFRVKFNHIFSFRWLYWGFLY